MVTQADMLRAIIEHKQAHDGNSPSVRELQERLGLQTSSAVFHHLVRLKRAGLIRIRDFHARSIEVVGATWSPPAP